MYSYLCVFGSSSTHSQNIAYMHNAISHFRSGPHCYYLYVFMAREKKGMKGKKINYTLHDDDCNRRRIRAKEKCGEMIWWNVIKDIYRTHTHAAIRPRISPEIIRSALNYLLSIWSNTILCWIFLSSVIFYHWMFGVAFNVMCSWNIQTSEQRVYTQRIFDFEQRLYQQFIHRIRRYHLAQFLFVRY